MANMPMPPQPQLDGVPPSPPGMAAGGGPNPSLQMASPSADMGGDMQVTQLVLQAAAEAAKLIDLIGQAKPTFAPTGQMLIMQLRDGIKASLQQGSQSSEPSLQQASQGLGMMQNPQDMSMMQG